MGQNQSSENGQDKQGLKGMVLCGREMNCGGCMDVDNQNTKLNQGNNAPLDHNGQLTQPAKTEFKQMLKNQKQGQWNNPSDATYGTDSQQLRGSYRNSANQQNSYQQEQSSLMNQQSPPKYHQQEQQIMPMPMKNQGPDGQFNIFANNEIQNELNPDDKNRKLMLQKLVKEARTGTLQLKVLSSAHLEKDFTLLINPMGIVPPQDQNYESSQAMQQYENGPRRGEFDGYTYFGVEDGTKEDDDGESSKDGAGATGGYIEDATGKQVLRKEMNDFIIPTNNPNNSEASKEMPSANPMMGGNNHQGRQFYIQFDPLDKFYKIRDLGKGYGAFAKLQGSIIIRDSFLINIGESYVVSYLISTNQEDDDEQQMDNGRSQQAYKLKLKIFPPYNLENPDVVICQNEKQELVIGRSPNCDIRIDDQLISKMQSTIKFEDGNWILQDGHDDKDSTNGTWYYLNQEQAIQDGMIFKQNQTFFVANIV